MQKSGCAETAQPVTPLHLGKDAVDEFLQDWLEESKVPGWGDFSQIESPVKVKGFPWLNTFPCKPVQIH